MKVNTHRRFILIVLGLALVAALSWPSTGKAQGNVDEERIQEGEVIDRNMIINGMDVLIDGTVNGDVMAIGRTITVNGQINGSLLAIGETVVINGQVSNTVVSSSISIDLRPPAVIGRDIYFVGARLTLSDGAAVQRDLNCLALEAQFAGEIGRDLRATVGPLKIAGIIMGSMQDVFPAVGAAQPEGNPELSAPVRAAIISGASASILGISYNRLAIQQAPVDTEQLVNWSLSTLRNLIALVIVGLLGVLLFSGPLNKAGEEILQSPWSTMIRGFSVYVIGWFGFGLAILIVAIVTIFFITVSMPNLAFLFGSIGLLGTSLGAALFWLLIAYFSKLVVAILIGRLLLQRFVLRQADSKLLPPLLGVLLYVLAASIPFLGWVVSVIVTFFGIGALWAVTSPLVRGKKAAEVEVVPAAALAG
jgi:cytoskeletal protein CcmA (bactofilin family)